MCRDGNQFSIDTTKSKFHIKKKGMKHHPKADTFTLAMRKKKIRQQQKKKIIPFSIVFLLYSFECIADDAGYLIFIAEIISLFYFQITHPNIIHPSTYASICNSFPATLKYLLSDPFIYYLLVKCGYFHHLERFFFSNIGDIGFLLNYLRPFFFCNKPSIHLNELKLF